MSIQNSGFRIQKSAAGRLSGHPPSTINHQPKKSAFTLVEVLAAMAVLALLILALGRMFVEATSITKRGSTTLMRNSTLETAMETLLQDAESMMVNDRLACYVQADTADTGTDGFGFDDVWFIGSSGDQDDDMPYEYFHFYVTNALSTNAAGAVYRRFNLIKERMIFAVADDGRSRPTQRFYSLDPAYAQWWRFAKLFPGGVWDRQTLADNVVRFDVYCTGWKGDEWMGGRSGVQEFDSTLGPGGNAALRGVPPAAFDIYLQMTSPETAVEAGMALLSSDSAVQRKGREMMIRDSSSLFGRAVPVNGSARYNAVTIYGTNSTSYYEN
jgi:prepilin-type N-terminal cleavage/methylation domain-containing protein